MADNNKARSSYYELTSSNTCMMVSCRCVLSLSRLLLLLLLLGSLFQPVVGFTGSFLLSTDTKRPSPFVMLEYHHHCRALFSYSSSSSSSSLFSSTKEQSETTKNIKNSLDTIKKAKLIIPESENEIAFRIASFTSPVLQQVYRNMLQHVAEFGNPNIPLGTSTGRQCQTLRRLHIQQKLTIVEVQALDDLGFYWHKLEDVYYTGDFNDLLQRLKDYQAMMLAKNVDSQNGGDEVDLFPPKKYPTDPELGAWVTGIRRVGRDGVRPEHLTALENQVNFAWVSQRTCGSKFMQQYRAVLQRLEDIKDENEKKSALLHEEPIQQWVYAQRETAARGGLSETRLHYMETLLGEDWRTVDMNSL
jgi:hypothetical protein